MVVRRLVLVEASKVKASVTLKKAARKRWRKRMRHAREWLSGQLEARAAEAAFRESGHHYLGAPMPEGKRETQVEACPRCDGRGRVSRRTRIGLVVDPNKCSLCRGSGEGKALGRAIPVYVKE